MAVAHVTHGNRQAVLLCHDNDYITSFLKKGKFYEDEMLSFIEGLLIVKTDGCIIDVGANIGNHSIFFGMFTKLFIHAFEPSKDSYEMFVKNISANDKNKPIIAHNLAVGNEKGKVKINRIDAFNKGRDTVIPGGDIDMVRLDDFLEKPDKVQLMKIDVEGYEPHVLMGAIEILKRDKPYLFIEAHTAVDKKVLDDILEPMGYKARLVFGVAKTYFFSV